MSSQHKKTPPKPAHAWAYYWRRVKDDSVQLESIFPYSRDPILTSWVDTKLPEKGHIVLCGGGRGNLILHLKKLERTFGIMDIAEIPCAHAPVKVHNFETPVERQALVQEGGLSLVSTFSSEYGDLTSAMRTFAGLLLPGEQFMWLSHHSDSDIIKEFRKLPACIRLLKKCKEIMEKGRMQHAAKELEEGFERIFTYNMLATCNGLGLIPIPLDIDEIEGKINVLGGAAAHMLRIRILIQLMPIVEKEDVLGQLGCSIESFEATAKRTEELIQRNLRSLDDLNRYAQGHFTLEEGIISNSESGTPHAIAAQFRKK